MMMDLRTCLQRQQLQRPKKDLMERAHQRHHSRRVRRRARLRVRLANHLRRHEMFPDMRPGDGPPRHSAVWPRRIMTGKFSRAHATLCSQFAANWLTTSPACRGPLPGHAARCAATIHCSRRLALKKAHKLDRKKANIAKVPFRYRKNLMTAPATNRMIVPFAALAVVCGLVLVLAIQLLRREPPLENQGRICSTGDLEHQPRPSRIGSRRRSQSAQAQANALIAGLAGSPALPKSDDAGEPTFDVARIEPTGEAVIAGRSRPGATVELLRNGELHDRTVADQSGQFVTVPSSRLPSGTYDLTLRSREPNGKQVDLQTERRCGDRAEVNRPTGRGASNTGQAHRGVVAAGIAKADARYGHCGSCRDRFRRQIPCERPRAARRHREAVSQ